MCKPSSVSGIGTLHRSSPLCRVLVAPVPVPPDSPAGATPGTTAAIKSGAHRYNGVHAPPPDTHHERHIVPAP